MKKAIVTFVILFAVFSVSAFSQVGKFGIGGHGTFYSAAADEEEREFAFGIHARARISSNLGLEASMEFRQEDLLEDNATLKLYPIQFSLLYYLLPNSKVGLYGLGGFGFTRSSVSGDLFGEDAENTDISYHFGFGVEIPVSQSLGISGDIRYLDMNLDLGSILTQDLNTSGWQSNFGITFYF